MTVGVVRIHRRTASIITLDAMTQFKILFHGNAFRSWNCRHIVVPLSRMHKRSNQIRLRPNGAICRGNGVRSSLSKCRQDAKMPKPGEPQRRDEERHGKRPNGNKSTHQNRGCKHLLHPSMTRISGGILILHLTTWVSSYSPHLLRTYSNYNLQTF